MKFTLEIELGNDAMQTYDDIAEALCSVADFLHDNTNVAGPNEATYSNRQIFDANGNRVGSWDIETMNAGGISEHEDDDEFQPKEDETLEHYPCCGAATFGEHRANVEQDFCSVENLRIALENSRR